MNLISDQPFDFNNLTILGPLDFGVVSLPELGNLSIAFLRNDATTTANAITDAAKSISLTSKGIDILITADWPREMHHFIDDIELTELRASEIG